MSYLVVVLVAISFSMVDARVYCTTNNLTFFMSAGYSCPVTCANIIAAVESLKKRDYNILLSRDDLDIRTKRPYRSENKLVNRNFIKPADIARIQKELYRLPIFEKKPHHCEKLLKANKTDSYRICKSRRFGKLDSFDAGFIRRMTKILNRFALAEYQFTNEMTVLLLRKIFGSRMDLRQGEQVVSLIVNYLKQAVKKSRQMTRQRKTVIRLASQHCMTIQLTGCFCVKGYVEKDNLCVAPKHCIVPLRGELDEKQAEYLSRIILN